MKNDKYPLVSIVFIVSRMTNDAQDATLYAAKIFKTLENQIYKNYEIIISHFSSGFNKQSFLEFVEANVNIPVDVDIKFVEANEPYELFSKAIESASEDSKYIFVKTDNPIIWMNDHIANHVEEFESNRKGKNFQLSNVVIKNIMYDISNPFGTLAYRVGEPKWNEILLDEVSFRNNKEIFPNYKNLIQGSNFLLKEYYEHIRFNGLIRNGYITVINLIPVNDQNQSNKLFALNTGYSSQKIKNVDSEGNILPDDEIGDDLIVVEQFPTVCGEEAWDEEHNNVVRKKIEDYVKDNKKQIRNIGVKRTMAAGDVICTQPLLKHLSEKYPAATIHFYTMNSPLMLTLANRFDVDKSRFVVHGISTGDTNPMFTDVLANVQEELDLKYDLDLSYESHKSGFIDGYFAVAGEQNVNKYNTKLLPLESDMLKDVGYTKTDNVIVINAEASGWGGRVIRINVWMKVLEYLKSKGFKIALTSNTNDKENDFVKALQPMMQYIDYVQDLQITNAEELQYSTEYFYSMIQNAVAYFGTEGGPSHIANSLGLPTFIIFGATSKDKIYTYSDNVIEFSKPLECLGCRHNFYLDRKENSVSFVSPCTNQNQFECMTFNDDDIERLISYMNYNFLNKLGK